MSALSPEEIAWKVAEEIVRQNHKLPFCLTESPTAVFDMDSAVAAIAAAIREDRAGPVSESEIDAGIVALREYDPRIFHNSAYNRTKFRNDIRAALEAARKARAGDAR